MNRLGPVLGRFRCRSIPLLKLRLSLTILRLSGETDEKLSTGCCAQLCLPREGRPPTRDAVIFAAGRDLLIENRLHYKDRMS